MSAASYEPYGDEDGGYCWATPMHGKAQHPAHLPYAVFLELEGGEFGEPEDTTDHIVWYPTREAALAALELARQRAGTTEGDGAV